MHEICAQCASQGLACGDKLHPSDDQLQRYNDAKEKENEKTVRNFIRTRRARGQDWETIFAITDPDGSIAPCPANGQPSQLEIPVYASYPQQLHPSRDPMQFSTPYIPTQNAFGQEYTGSDAASFPSMPSTISSTDQMMMNPDPNYITTPRPQLTQLSQPFLSSTTTSFEPLASEFYTTAEFPSFNDFGTNRTQAAFPGTRPTNWQENENVTTMSETANNWPLSPPSPLLTANPDVVEPYDFDFWDSSANDQSQY
jgi:hypothetical protein